MSVTNNVETVNVTSKKNTASKNKKTPVAPKMGLLAQARAKNEEMKRENSIFLTMEAGKDVIAVIKGIGVREQEFKKGISQVIDMKIEVDEARVKTAGIPDFATQATDDILNIMEKYAIDPSVLHPVGTYANLKTYNWTATPDIPVVIRPSKPAANGSVWIGRITEIPMEQKQDILEEI